MDLFALVPYTKFAHIAAMFVAASVVIGGDLLFLRIATEGNAATTAKLGHAIRRRGPLTRPVYGVGILFGVVTALLGGFNFFAPWLIGAYLESRQWSTSAIGAWRPPIRRSSRWRAAATTTPCGPPWRARVTRGLHSSTHSCSASRSS